MPNEEKLARFTELADKSKTICPGCRAGSVPMETAGTWFHVLKPDATYGLAASGSSMTQPCMAGSILAEMQVLKAKIAQ